jgi:hypothetical protein
MIKAHFPVSVRLSRATFPTITETQTLLKEMPIKSHFDNYLGICRMKNFVKSTMFMKHKLIKILSEFKIRRYSDFNQDKISNLLIYLQKNYHNDSINKGHFQKLVDYIPFIIKTFIISNLPINYPQ